MVDRHYKVLVATMRITTNTTPHTLGDNKVKYWLTNLVVVIAAGKRPVSIPNLEAKPTSADGTAPGRVWESRTPPQHSSKEGGWNTVPNPPLFFTYTHPHNTHQSHAQVRFPFTLTTHYLRYKPGEYNTNPDKQPTRLMCNGLANTRFICPLA